MGGEGRHGCSLEVPWGVDIRGPYVWMQVGGVSDMHLHIVQRDPLGQTEDGPDRKQHRVSLKSPTTKEAEGGA